MKRALYSLKPATLDSTHNDTLSPHSPRSAALALVDRWANALNHRSALAVTQLYDEDAVLLATFEPKPLLTQAERLEYFTRLVERPGISVSFEQEFVRVFEHHTAVVSGIYHFSTLNGRSFVSSAARYTLVMQNKPGAGWLILEHHSSLMPTVN